MSNETESERVTVERLVNEHLYLFSVQRWNDWIELWADDGVLEFPFAPSGRRARYVGKTEILAYMQPLGGRINIDALEYFDLHPMLDPNVICFEMGFKGHIVATGATYNQKYISIVEAKHGKIFRYREYWNPIVSMDANGNREAWTAAFGSPEQDDAP